MQQVIGIVPILGLLGMLVCIGPLMLGLHEYYLRVHRRDNPQFSQLFNGFSNFVLGMGIYLLTFLIAMAAVPVSAIPGGILMAVVGSQPGGSPESNPLFWVGMVLILIPIVILSFLIYLLFSMVYFIAIDEPEEGVMHTCKKSLEMMKGHKSKLLMMLIVFFGWTLLAIPTLGIGMLWVAPYMYTSLAAFYDDIKVPAEAWKSRPDGWFPA